MTSAIAVPRINFFILLPPQSGARLLPPHTGFSARWPKTITRGARKRPNIFIRYQDNLDAED
jgi:hypothetical protein